MDVEIRHCASAEEVRNAIAPIGYYFGRSAPREDQAERLTRVLPAQRVYAAWEGGRAVGGLGAFPFKLTIPGGRVPAAGVTVAGVLPTHRRRGVLRAMMRALLDACYDQREPVAYLWATRIRSAAVLASAWHHSQPRWIWRASDRRSTRRMRRLDVFNSFHPAQPRSSLPQFTKGWLWQHRVCSREAQRGGRLAHWPIRNGGAEPMEICNVPSSRMRVGPQLTHSIESTRHSSAAFRQVQSQ